MVCLPSVASSLVDGSSLGSLAGSHANGGEVALGVDAAAGGGQGIGGGVDTDGDVADEAVLDAVTELGDADDGTVAVGAGTRVERVLGVGGTVQSIQVGGVGLVGVNLVEQVLLEEELADVLDGAGRVRDAVSDVGLGGDVDVRGTGDVVAGELGQELNDAVVVGDLDAAQEGLVVGGAVGPRGPAVQELCGVGVDAGEGRVGAGGVAVPDGQGDVGEGLARLDVDDTNVEVEVDAALGLAEVVADHLAVDAVGAPDGVGGQDARVVLDGRVVERVALEQRRLVEHAGLGAAGAEAAGPLLKHLGLALLDGGGALVATAAYHGCLGAGLLLGHALRVGEDRGQGQGVDEEVGQLHCGWWTVVGWKKPKKKKSGLESGAVDRSLMSESGCLIAKEVSERVVLLWRRMRQVNVNVVDDEQKQDGWKRR